MFVTDVSIRTWHSIAKRLPGLQRVLNSLLRFAFAAQGLESFALQIQDVLLADWRSGRNIPPTQNFRHLIADLDFVLGDVVRLAHQMNSDFESSQDILAGRGNVPARLWRLIAGAYKFERPCFGVRKYPFAIHGDLVSWGEKAEQTRLVGGCRHFCGRDSLKRVFYRLQQLHRFSPSLLTDRLRPV